MREEGRLSTFSLKNHEVVKWVREGGKGNFKKLSSYSFCAEKSIEWWEINGGIGTTGS